MVKLIGCSLVLEWTVAFVLVLAGSYTKLETKSKESERRKDMTRVMWRSWQRTMDGGILIEA